MKGESNVKCGPTHYLGCDCVEAAHQAELLAKDEEISRLRNIQDLACHYYFVVSDLGSDLEARSEAFSDFVSGMKLFLERGVLCSNGS